jgi:hypothetical protein
MQDADMLSASCFGRGLAMRAEARALPQLAWYTLGALILAGTSLLWTSLESEAVLQQRIVLGIFGALFGALALIAIGEFIRPSSAIAQPPGPGCSNSVGGNNTGTMTNNCVFNIGQQRLQFSDDLGTQLLAAMPGRKFVRLWSMGNTADQKVSDDIQNFLQLHGYTIDRGIIGTRIPPPDRKISLGEDKDGYVLAIAPSAE